jgi:hypothetical protein
MSPTRVVTIAAAAALLSPIAPASAHGTCTVTTTGAIFGPGGVFANGFIECTSAHTVYDLDVCIQVATLPQLVTGTYSTPVCRSFPYNSTVARTDWSGSFTWNPTCETTVRHWRARVTGQAGGTHIAQTVFSPGSFQLC